MLQLGGNLGWISDRFANDLVQEPPVAAPQPVHQDGHRSFAQTRLRPNFGLALFGAFAYDPCLQVFKKPLRTTLQ